MEQLTEEDFKLLIDALEKYPDRHKTEEILQDILFTTMTSGKNDAAISGLRKERDTQRKKNEGNIELEKENIGILKGKIISLKRELQHQANLNEIKS